MVRFTLDLKSITPLSRKQIEYLVQVAGRYVSHIMYIHQSRTVNGKSMLGLLSLGATGATPVQLMVEGPDEEAAADMMKRIFEEGVILPKSTQDAAALLSRIKRLYQDILGEKLAGLYVHGSMAFGCFCWEKSDIDLLAVVHSDPGTEKKVKLIRVLQEMMNEAPPKGFEMSVMLQKDCRELRYPTPYILHYSPMHRSAFAADPAHYCANMHGEDPDLICHIATLKKADITLLGPQPLRMFGRVDPEDVLDSIRKDCADAPNALHDQPVYYVLNLCRAIAFLRQKTVMSKKQGAQWAMKNLDQGYQGLIQAALNAYQNGTDMFYNQSAAEDFMDDCLDELGV